MESLHNAYDYVASAHLCAHFAKGDENHWTRASISAQEEIRIYCKLTKLQIF
jgi:hypothetical protein